MLQSKTLGVMAMILAGAATYACSDDPKTTPTPTPGNDGGTDSAFSEGGPGPGKKNGFQFTVSGEDLANLGYDFGTDSKANRDPPAFVDGWAVKFEHIIVTVDKIRLNADPDKDPANPATVGPVVASVDGPWAVDVVVGGDIVGKSGSADEKTVAIATVDTQSDGKAFDPSARYAFTYETVAASASAKEVNLDAAGKALYEQAKTGGWATIYQGTATYKGPEPAAGSVFAKMPKEVKFTFGMKNPATYINCQNTDLQEIAAEEFPRGLQASADKVTTAQLTIHTDHSFWSKLNIEGTELHFDQIAALASTYGTVGAASGTVTLEDLVNADFTAFKTRNGEVLPARSLVPDYTAAAGQLAFDPNGASFTKANSYAGFVQYSAVSGNHLNADGLCKIKNNFVP